MKREDNTVYIATISGGKDSTVATDLLLKNSYPVDYILFHDTLQEFPLMYDYIEKLKVYFKDRYNKDIIVLKPKTTFEDWCYGTINKKGAVRTALKDVYSSWEEAKADILGLYMVNKLIEKGEIKELTTEDCYVTFMAGIFRSVRFGAASSHGKANTTISTKP